jgi:hypothetical protein
MKKTEQIEATLHHSKPLCDVCGEEISLEVAKKRANDKVNWPNGPHWPGVVTTAGRYGHGECFLKTGELRPPPAGFSGIDGMDRSKTCLSVDANSKFTPHTEWEAALKVCYGDPKDEED